MTQDLISYRHVSDTGNRTRFVQPRSESLPSWARDVQPHSAPFPCQTTLQDVWGWLTRGLLKRLGDNPDLHQAFLGASNDALFLEDGETGELVIVDCQDGEGLSVHVYRSDLAWNLPLDGSQPEDL